MNKLYFSVYAIEGGFLVRMQVEGILEKKPPVLSRLSKAFDTSDYVVFIEQIIGNATPADKRVLELFLKMLNWWKPVDIEVSDVYWLPTGGPCVDINISLI
jgi:hypothetical protein